MTSKRLCVIGNGVAGMSAIEEIRRHDNTSEIFLFSKETQSYYYRASLSEWLSGKNTREMLRGRVESFSSLMKVKEIPAMVQAIDAKNQYVITEDQNWHYDELLIATGATPRGPAIPGNVHIPVYRNLSDAEYIKESLGECARLLIVGGGVLGLELAAAVNESYQCGITLVQHSDMVGRPLLDRTSSEWVLDRMRADGIDILLNDSISKAESGIAYLRSGTEKPFDLIVATIGVNPVVPPMEGLQTGNGILVDEHCCTNIPHVYAAGDCTQYLDRSAGQWISSRTWLEASQQGMTAGANMVGIERSYPMHTVYNASYIYKERYVFMGDPHGEGGTVHEWKRPDRYRKIRLESGRLVGALLINERIGHLAIFDAINQRAVVPEGYLADPAFQWNHVNQHDWDYRWF